MPTLKKIVALLLAASLMPALSGCALAVGAAAGGAAVYIMKDKGYTVQSPVTKKKEQD
jgi:TRAP-type C4-dicarboxylate transport system permease large subunit